MRIVKFLTGAWDAFVVEDADHLLQPRAKGNDHLHRFLSIADGIVRAQARKIIFSTNLPNLGDLDDALVRPGRCFARVSTKKLSPGEASTLLTVLGRERGTYISDAIRARVEGDKADRSLAAVFKIMQLAAASQVPVPERASPRQRQTLPEH
jgi:hypothetical protein